MKYAIVDLAVCEVKGFVYAETKEIAIRELSEEKGSIPTEWDLYPVEEDIVIESNNGIEPAIPENLTISPRSGEMH